jgi:transcriptional regulator with XRE-family HTH domain
MDDERAPWIPCRSEAETNPAKTPHLHIRTVEGLLLGEAVAITGGAKALLQLRAQIDRALKDETSHPFEEAVYRDVHGVAFEVAVKWARSEEELAERAGTTQTTVARTERDAVQPEVTTIRKLAAALDVPIIALLEGA